MSIKSVLERLLLHIYSVLLIYHEIWFRFTMLRIDGWREYEKRETNPEIQKQNVTLKKKKDISLGVSSRLETSIVS